MSAGGASGGGVVSAGGASGGGVVSTISLSQSFSTLSNNVSIPRSLRYNGRLLRPRLSFSAHLCKVMFLSTIALLARYPTVMPSSTPRPALNITLSPILKNLLPVNGLVPAGTVFLGMLMLTPWPRSFPFIAGFSFAARSGLASMIACVVVLLFAASLPSSSPAMVVCGAGAAGGVTVFGAGGALGSTAGLGGVTASVAEGVTVCAEGVTAAGSAALASGIRPLAVSAKFCAPCDMALPSLLAPA